MGFCWRIVGFSYLGITSGSLVIRPQSARAIKYSLKSAEGNLSNEYRRSQSLTFKLNIFLTCKDALPYIFHPLVNKHRRVTAVFAALAWIIHDLTGEKRKDAL